MRCSFSLQLFDVTKCYLQGIMMFGFVMHEPLKYEDYTYPAWANIVGWCLALSSMLCMPVFAVVSILRAKGSFLEVRSFLQ